MRPEGRLPDLVAYRLLGGQMNVVTLHASGSVQLQYSNRPYYMQGQARRTSCSMWRFLYQIIRYDGTWRKSWKRKSLRTWGFKSRTWGSAPTVCQGFFLFLCVVDYGLGSLSHMLRRLPALQPAEGPLLAASGGLIWPTTCVLFSSGSQRHGRMRVAWAGHSAGEDIRPATVCAITFIIDIIVTVPAPP
jgi:hypothetical protein